MYLLFLIKKHNNNKTAGYKWHASLHNLLTKTNKIWHGIHNMQYYIRTNNLQKV